LKEIKNKYAYYHFPWQLMMILIFILSSIPGDRFPEIQFRFADKVAHFFVFGILGLLLARSIRITLNPFWKSKYIVWSILIGIFYGLIDEWHQMFIPGRYASMSDLIADLLGIVCFVSVYFWWRNRKRLDDSIC
jgi:VanZ family protein